MNFKNKMRARNAASSIGASLFGALFSMFIISGLLLLLLAFLLYRFELSEGIVKTGIIVIYVLSGVAGGFFMGRLRKEKKFLWGLLAGVLYFAILFLISLIVKGGFNMDWIKLMTTFILCAASGMIGGMIS